MEEHRGRPALLGDGVSLTYAELDRHSSDLAERLTARGLRRGDRVAVTMPSTVDAILAIVAVLRAGAAYVPLDPNGPAERLQFMLADSGARFLLRGPDVEAVAGASAPPPDEPPLAYIIYTSGSTGTPKGVAVPRRAVTALADALQTSIYDRLEPHRRVALLASLSFDASVQQVFAALLGGHALLPVTADVKRDPAALCDLLSRHGIDVADGTPSLLELLVRHAPERLRSVPVRQWIIGGEPLTRDLLRRFFLAAAGGVSIGNVYGLTECGVDSTLALLGRDDAVGTRSVPIGHPLPNAELLLLDAAGHPLPCGAVGEIAIGGPGLAVGYLNDPVLTAQRFVPHPFAAGQRLFRTGDRGWIDADGAFHFVERRDEQVKVRGHRVDLGDVRAALLSCGGVEQAHVLLHRDRDGQPEIAAFVTASRPVARGALRDHLKKRLAEPMRPRILIQVDDWPLTTSGKLDRKALLDRAAAPEETPAGASDDDRLTAIFRRIVGDPYLAADDDFFDGGGNSLAALEAIAQIAAELGAHVDVRTIYQARTAAELGRVLRSRQHAPRRLVALRPSRPDAPDVFLLPPSLGVSHAFLPLAARLPVGLNVWGLDYRNAEQALEPSVEALAAALIEELPRQSAGRPVTLVGYSAGALVAFEMVRLLERRGWRPALIVIDTKSEREERRSGGQAILPVRDRAQDRQDCLSSTTSLDVHARELVAIAMRYQPAHLIGADVVALEAAGNPVPARMESWSAWTSGRFRHAAVPGTHDTLLDPANVGELARQLQLSLQFLEGGHHHAAIAGDAADAALRRLV
jgi:fengycin family lipopeptide synthetase D